MGYIESKNIIKISRPINGSSNSMDPNALYLTRWYVENTCSWFKHVRKKTKWYSCQLWWSWHLIGEKIFVRYLSKCDIGVHVTYSWAEPVSNHRKCNLGRSSGAHVNAPNIVIQSHQIWCTISTQCAHYLHNVISFRLKDIVKCNKRSHLRWCLVFKVCVLLQIFWV